MPYIASDRKDDIRYGEDDPESPGELNFIITHYINRYRGNHTNSYQTLNDILGALEGAKAEFYRRVVAPYEDKKMAENGDVY